MAPEPATGTAVTAPPGVLGYAARGAGFQVDPVAASQVHDDEVTIAVAIALAESGGHSDSISPTGDYGAWQINYQAHPDLFTQYHWALITDNAKMAHAVFSGRGWDAWTTYRNGKYKDFLAQARTWDENLTGAAITDVGVTHDNILARIADAVGSVAAAIFKGMVWMANPHNWVRAALVGVGGALIIGALVTVAKPSNAPIVNMVKGVK